jgi:hypothetical protein
MASHARVHNCLLDVVVDLVDIGAGAARGRDGAVELLAATGGCRRHWRRLCGLEGTSLRQQEALLFDVVTTLQHAARTV